MGCAERGMRTTCRGPENEHLERVLKGIIKMFVHGHLVYRSRETRVSHDMTGTARQLRMARGASLHEPLPMGRGS